MSSSPMPALATQAPTGLLLPESILNTPLFGLLAAFVAVNTVVFLALAVVKMLPAVPLSMLFIHRNRRIQNRSIYPNSAEIRQRAPSRDASEDARPLVPPTV